MISWQSGAEKPERRLSAQGKVERSCEEQDKTSDIKITTKAFGKDRRMPITNRYR